MDKKKHSRGKENIIGEPQFPYKKIIVTSFEEQEQLNRLYSASLSPVDRLAYLLQLNINAYGRNSTKINGLGTKIYPF